MEQLQCQYIDDEWNNASDIVNVYADLFSKSYIPSSSVDLEDIIAHRDSLSIYKFNQDGSLSI